MGRFGKIFSSTTKPIIAMAHVPALPGTPLYDGSMNGLIDSVGRDIEVLCDAGFDAVLFCNENDRPYRLKAGLEDAAALSRVVAETHPSDRPYGVDFLWDPRCALAVAAATQAHFMREVVSGAWESDMGLWQPDAAEILRERRRLDVCDLGIFMNITPEFASAIGRRDAAEIARSTAVSSLPDAILVSGPMAGAEPSLSALAQVRQTVPADIPVLLNTGAKADTIGTYLTYADGCIVGSDLKIDGYTWNPVDPDRARRFIDAARNA
jgi:membrane complex biogenesis BtpA family protein